MNFIYLDLSTQKSIGYSHLHYSLRPMKCRNCLSTINLFSSILNLDQNGILLQVTRKIFDLLSPKGRQILDKIEISETQIHYIFYRLMQKNGSIYNGCGYKSTCWIMSKFNLGFSAKWILMHTKYYPSCVSNSKVIKI